MHKIITNFPFAIPRDQNKAFLFLSIFSILKLFMKGAILVISVEMHFWKESQVDGIVRLLNTAQLA